MNISKLPIIDLRGQMDWRLRAMSEACTLSLWIGAVLLLNVVQAARKAYAHFAMTPYRQGAAAHAALRGFATRLTGADGSLTHSLATKMLASGGGRQTAAWIASAGVNMPRLFRHHLTITHAAHHALSTSGAFPAHSGLPAFGAALLGFAMFLWLWKCLSAVGQKPPRAIGVDYARHFAISAALLDGARKSQICTVHHKDDGQIETISSSEDAPSAAVESGTLLAFDAPEFIAKRRETTIAA